jgi:RHS repeat-associated protein
MGHVLIDSRITNNATKSTVYAYLPYVDGSTSSITYPSGRTVDYIYTAAERALSAADPTGPINYALNAKYAPTGELASLQNGGSLYSTFIYNSRLQPCWMYSTNTSSGAPTNCTQSGVANGAILDYQYNFEIGVNDNGNVYQISNRRDPTRTQNFTYDTLNRIATAQTQTSGVTIPNANCWGLTFGYDPWANLLSWSTTGPAGCSEPLPLNLSVSNLNRIVSNTVAGQVSNYCYDSPGNLIFITASGASCPTSGPYQYVYDAENHLTSTAGVNYSYDGDGKRVMKSSGKLYWYGTSSDPLDETDASGNLTDEYIFFNGERIARRDPSNNVDYYFADQLGTARVVANAGGTILDDSDFYPFGGERSVVGPTSGNTYLFTGKERDSESGLDDFGDRYYSSAMARFTSVDPIWVKIDRLLDPQRLNLYAYGRNNPLLFTDPDGRDVTIGRCSIGAAQDCFNQLQAGLTKEDREHVKLVTGDGKNGCDKGASCVMADADYKSDSKNFQVLQKLANDHSATATVDVLKPNDSFDLKTVISFDRKTGEKLGILSTTPGDPNEGTGFAGYTFFPYHQGDPGPFSPDDTTHVVANTVSDSLAATIHHELRHVFLGDFGRSAKKAAHGQPGVDQQTKAAEDEAKKNQNQ